MDTLASLRTHLEDLQLQERVVEEVLRLFKQRPLGKNHVFVRAGEVDARLGFVVSGLFSMEVVREDGRLFIKDFLGPGSFLLGTFDPAAENQVTLRALRRSMVLEARYSDILLLQEEHPEFRAASQRGLERRYESLCQRLEQLTGLEAREGYERFRTTFKSIEKDIPLHLVAAYLNITPTQLSRIRKSDSLNLG